MQTSTCAEVVQQLPTAPGFYQEFTLRNTGFISAEDQLTLRQATILVAGCGSTGGSTIEVLVRSGAEHLILADNGSYELNNINRQNMTLADIGRAKPAVFAERCHSINPNAEFELHTDGITPANVTALVARADVVIDAVDVTTQAGLRMKWRLHEEAQRQRKAVISGYDMGTAQFVPIYDYRNPDQPLLDGVISAHHIEELDPLAVCSLLVPERYLRNEIIDELERVYAGKDFVSQLAIAANLFGIIATAAVIELLAGRPVNSDIYQDVRNWIQPNAAERSSASRDAVLADVRRRRGPQGVAHDSVAAYLANYRAPRLLPLLRNEIIAPVASSGGLAVYQLRHANTPEEFIARATEFAFVNYARVGFVDTRVALAEFGEPLSNFRPDDRHMLTVDTASGQLLAYATIKAAADHGVPFSSTTRNWLSAERAFGRAVFDDVRWIQSLPIEGVREVGRITRCQSLAKEDPRATRATALMLTACLRHALDPDNQIAAIAGDGEPSIMVATLQFLGARPQLLQDRPANPPEGYLYGPRYHGRQVFPLAFRMADVDQTQLGAVEAALQLPDAEWQKARETLRHNPSE